MESIHQINHVEDIREQLDSIIRDGKTDRILKSTVCFITELLGIKLGTTVDVSLTCSKNCLELCFLYRARCYNPMVEDTDPENPLELFLKRYYKNIVFSYERNTNTNKLLFTYCQE